ncbi:hypothetical protein HMPREF0322_00525 [Desulfitobacterium hafniense DP7]|uniref:Uncharacterized protein n=1 Tax=Desulfitobacterium hafniense DP7 TaxID=537010 RepID=G9XHU9_DESHA|nr:hypothetical protein HMPREF0322_00525 [Desulfitobacterium hafniense DP7]
MLNVVEMLQDSLGRYTKSVQRRASMRLINYMMFLDKKMV